MFGSHYLYNPHNLYVGLPHGANSTKEKTKINIPAP